jgi:hypothetical protein
MTTTFLDNGPRNAESTLVLAHGAGQPCDSPFLTRIAAGLAGAGVRVLRFDFPYMRRAAASGGRRPPDRTPVLLEAWRTALDDVIESGVDPLALFIGGKSLGGRIATMIGCEREAAGVVCLGYPFHPPGRPERRRVEHLSRMSSPALFCQGERDPFGNRAEVARYDLPSNIRLCWLADGDHGFEPRKSSGRTLEQNLDEAVVAIAAFLEDCRES